MTTHAHARSAALLTLAAAAALAPHASADDAASLLPQRYRLTRESSYVWGCFAPCACPISIATSIRGTFDVSLLDTNPFVTTHEVSNVRWRIGAALFDRHLTGFGTYAIISEFGVRHQMALDLSTNGEPPEHFDSGIAAGGAEFPNRIDIVIDVNDQVCFDTVIHVVAVPARPRPADLNDDGAVDSGDLAMMLGAWATDDIDCDLDFDGTVSSTDLAELLGDWG